MTAAEIRRVLTEALPSLEDLPQADWSDLAAAVRRRRAETNELLAEFAAPAGGLGLLLGGSAEVTRVEDDGEPTTLATLGPGDLVGLQAVLTGEPHWANVVAREPTEILWIEPPTVEAVLLSHPPTVRALSRRLQRRPLPTPEATTVAGDTLARAVVLALTLDDETLSYRLGAAADPVPVAAGHIDAWREPRARHHRDRPAAGDASLAGGSLETLVAALAHPLHETGHRIDAVAVRIIDGGDRPEPALRVTPELIDDLMHASPWTPEVQHLQVRLLAAAVRQWPRAHGLAVFDDHFFGTLPSSARLYALPSTWCREHRVKRRGQDGLLHERAAQLAARALNRPLNGLELIVCHLGERVSLCAVDHGRAVEVTGGCSGLGGLPGATACGDIDPGILLRRLEQGDGDPAALEHWLAHESGWLGLSALSGDIPSLQRAAEQGHLGAVTALKTLGHQVRKTVGAFTAAMGGLDALVFTGPLGRHSVGLRAEICQGLGGLGISLDIERNRRASAEQSTGSIHGRDSRVAVLVVDVDPLEAVTRAAVRGLRHWADGRRRGLRRDRPIPVEISAHHVHLSTAHIAALFGPGHRLKPVAELSQPGQFAAEEQVTLEGPKGRIPRVRVLGPARRRTQVEIAQTEQYRLGINAPLRASGDLAGSAGITLVGPAGRLSLTEGVISALRHLHAHPEEAASLGLQDGDIIRVRIDGDRELVFGDVQVRVSPHYRLALHLDTDEANAAGLSTPAVAHLLDLQERP